MARFKVERSDADLSNEANVDEMVRTLRLYIRDDMIPRIRVGLVQAAQIQNREDRQATRRRLRSKLKSLCALMTAAEMYETY